jgi:hypothetical protein
MSAAVLDFRHSIVGAHAAASGAIRDAVAHAVQAGELLIQAKAAMRHGTFGAFCSSLPFTESTARGYMRLARLDPANRQRVAEMPLRAALLAIAGPDPQKPSPPIIGVPSIPQGSFGVMMWRDGAGLMHWLEVHPVLWPDGKTIGLHYAYLQAPETGDIVVECSRRPVRADAVSVADLAQHFGAPLDTMRVIDGMPILWGPAERGAYGERP